MHPASIAERELDRWIAKYASLRKAEAMQAAMQEGAYSLPSTVTPNDIEEAWMAQVILNSLGHFLTRSDAFDLAIALQSPLLFREALTTDIEWVNKDPEDLEEVLLEHEILVQWFEDVSVTGLAGDGPNLYRRMGSNDVPYSPRKEAA
jgi:hypothetical protein